MSDSYAGKQARCPKCKTKFIIPGGKDDGALELISEEETAEPAIASRPVNSARGRGDSIWDADPDEDREEFRVGSSIHKAAASEESPHDVGNGDLKAAVGRRSDSSKPKKAAVPPKKAPVATHQESEPVESFQLDFSSERGLGPSVGVASRGTTGRQSAGYLPTPTSQHANGRQARRRSQGLPAWLWLAGGAGALVFVVLLGMLFLGGDKQDQAAGANSDAEAATDPDENTRPQLNRTALFQEDLREKALHARREKPGDNATRQEIIDYIDNGIVKIECQSLVFNAERGQPEYDWTSLGSGFVIDAERRLVATNFHVISHGRNAAIKFRNNQKYGVVGYRAVDPQSDLAIIEVTGLPPNVEELDLATDPDIGTGVQVLAIGHPHGVEFVDTLGKIVTAQPLSQMPIGSQIFLADCPPSTVWLESDVGLKPGNSGGPLLNWKADVIGINTWVDGKNGYSYSSHIKHLETLLANLSEEPVDLNEHFVPGERDRPIPARIVNSLLDQAVSRDWDFKDEESYQEILYLAYCLTVAEGDLELERAIQKAISTLRNKDWNQKKHIQPAAERAGKHFKEGDSDLKRGGRVFVFGEIVDAQPVPSGLIPADQQLTIKVLGGPESFNLGIYAATSSKNGSLIPDVRLSRGDKVVVLGMAAWSRDDGSIVPLALSKAVLPVRIDGVGGKPTASRPSPPRRPAGPFAVEAGPIFKGHRDKIRAVAVAPDGVIAASAADDNTIRIWELATGAELHVFEDNLSKINALAFSADSRTLMAASESKAALVFDLDALNQRGGIGGDGRGPQEPVTGVAHLGDDRVLAGSGDGKAYVFTPGAPGGFSMELGQGPVTAAASLDGRPGQVILGFRDGSGALLEIAQGTTRRSPIPSNGGEVRALAISPQSVYLAMGRASDGSTGKIDLLSIERRRAIGQLTAHTGSISGLAFLGDDRLISVSEDGTNRVWDIQESKELGRIEGHSGAATCVAAVPGTNQCLTGGVDKTLRLWTLK